MTPAQKMAHARSKRGKQGKKTRNISQASSLMQGHTATEIREAALKASAAGSLSLPSSTAALKHTTLLNAIQIPKVLELNGLYYVSQVSILFCENAHVEPFKPIWACTHITDSHLHPDCMKVANPAEAWINRSSAYPKLLTSWSTAAALYR